jgi:hypothetical protein
MHLQNSSLAQVCFLIGLMVLPSLGATARAQTPIYSSGGPLMSEQAAYDVN